MARERETELQGRGAMSGARGDGEDGTTTAAGAHKRNRFHMLAILTALFVRCSLFSFLS